MSTADTMRFICSGCGYRARIPSNYNGKVILCPKCQQMQIASPDGGEATGDTVRVSKLETAKGPTAGQVSVPDAEGRIRFTCVGCAYQAKLASSYAGKAIACPKCQVPNLVPPLAPDGGGGPLGNGEAPSAPRPAAQSEDDGISFDLGDGKSAKKTGTSTTAGAETVDDISFDTSVAKPAGAETVDDSSFAAAGKPAGAETVDDISFDTEAAKPAPAALKKPAPRPKPPPPLPVSGRPKTGVVRRGAKPAEPEPAAEDDEDEDDSEEPTMPSTPNPLIEKLKQPPVMAAAIGGGVLLILTITFLALWLGASGEAKRQREASESASAKAKDFETKVGKAEWAANETADKLAKMTAERDKAAADLKAAKIAVEEAEAKFKKTDAERADEYAKRKKAEDDFDALFKEQKELKAKREEDYKVRIDLQKKNEEEVQLRRDLQGQIKTLKEEAKAK